MESVKTTLANGIQEWRNSKGELHRENGPAYIWPNGAQSWWLNGKRHRIGGPSFVGSNGNQEWWFNGVKQPNEETIEWKSFPQEPIKWIDSNDLKAQHEAIHQISITVDQSLSIKANFKVDLKAQRKADGVCLECGDKGTFKAMALVCPVHGKIFG